jgi:hypothetical protein
MIVTYKGSAGARVSLDLTEQLGPRAEIEFFEFSPPPPEFRLTRNGVALQEWQCWADGTFDLQHPPTAKCWCRDGRQFFNDLEHRNDVATCGVLSKDLVIETRGLAAEFTLFVWPRQGTYPEASCRGEEN